MTRKILPALLAATVATAPSLLFSALVASYDGTSGDYIASSQTFQPRSNTTSATSLLTQKAWDTSTAWSPAANYSGPAFFGGFHVASTHDPAVGQQASIGLVFQPAGTPQPYGDTIRFQPNVASGNTSGVLTMVQRFGVVFATSEAASIGAGSSLTITGRETTDPTPNAFTTEYRWLLVAGGTVYVSQSAFELKKDGANTTAAFDSPATLANPAAESWAAWIPGADMSLGSLTYNVSGASITEISHVGYYGNLFTNLAGERTPTVDVLAFSADLTAVPEPSTYALIGGLATLGLVLWRRRPFDTHRKRAGCTGPETVGDRDRES